MAVRDYAELQRYNPLRRVDWRFERVLRMVERFPTPGRCTARDDAYVRRARGFVLRWRRGTEDDRELLWREEPGLYYAWLLHEGASEEPRTTFVMEARLLAGQSFEEVAHEADTIPDTVRWYEALFFNVADRLGRHDWVLRNALYPAAARAAAFVPEHKKRDKYYTEPIAASDYDYSLKFFAYYAGPVMLEFMLSGFVRGNRARTREECSEYASKFHSDMLAVRAAQAARNLSVDKWNVETLFAAHARLREIAKKGDGEGGKDSLYEKNIGAVLQEFPWAAGSAGRDSVAGTPLGRYDEEAAELRDEEMLLTAAGQPAPVTAELAGITVPPPGPKEAVSDGDARLR